MYFIVIVEFVSGLSPYITNIDTVLSINALTASPKSLRHASWCGSALYFLTHFSYTSSITKNPPILAPYHIITHTLLLVLLV